MKQLTPKSTNLAWSYIYILFYDTCFSNIGVNYKQVVQNLLSC